MDLKLPRDFTPAQADAVVERAKPALDLPEDATLRVEQVKQTRRATEIEFTCVVPTSLETQAADKPLRVCVDVNGKGCVKFDATGNLVSAEVKPLDPHQLDAIRDHVSKLVANDQVYVAAPGEKVDVQELRAQGKPWYVQDDEAGRPRLKRAYIA